MSNRVVPLLGAVAAAGAGYYLYTAGGDPKVAQKKFEADASKVSSQVKSELPGREKEAKKEGEALVNQAGNKFDQASADAKNKLADAEAKARELSQRAGKDINGAIDKFDRTVEKEASKAKGGISSWFGGK